MKNEKVQTLIYFEKSEKAYLKKVFENSGLTFSSGMRMAASYIAKKLESGEIKLLPAEFKSNGKN